MLCTIRSLVWMPKLICPFDRSPMNLPSEQRLNHASSFVRTGRRATFGRCASRLAAWCLVGGFAARTLADPIDAGPTDERGKVVHRSYVFTAAQNKTIPYAIFVPTSYDKTKPAPLVVLLHGLHNTPEQIMGYKGITQEAEKRGYIVVAPDGYNSDGWYGSRGSGNFFGSAKINPPPGSPYNLGQLSEQDVLNVLGIVRHDYAVDPKRIYLMGHSMGGGGTLYLGMKYKNQWAALAALAPAIKPNPSALEDIRTTPIIVVQGDHDQSVKVDNTRLWIAEMKSLNMDYQYIEIKGGDHLWSNAANPAMIAQVFDFFDHHPAGLSPLR